MTDLLFPVIFGFAMVLDLAAALGLAMVLDLVVIFGFVTIWATFGFEEFLTLETAGFAMALALTAVFGLAAAFGVIEVSCARSTST